MYRWVIVSLHSLMLVACEVVGNSCSYTFASCSPTLLWKRIIGETFIVSGKVLLPGPGT